MSLPDQLYDKKTLFTLSGSSVSVWLLTMVINNTFDLDQKQKWIGLIASLILSFIGATQIRKLTLTLATVAFFNGLLIYVTSAGIDSIQNGAGHDTASKSDTITTARLIPFLRSDPWWPAQVLVKENTALKEENTELEMSIVALHSSQDALRDSLANKPCETVNIKTSNCSQYLSEISNLKEQIKRLSATPAPTTSLGEQRKEIMELLKDIQAENSKVLKALEKYLNIPLEKPLDKKKTIHQLEEDIFAWRSSILDYEKQMEAIVKSK